MFVYDFPESCCKNRQGTRLNSHECSVTKVDFTFFHKFRNEVIVIGFSLKYQCPRDVYL